MDEFGAGLKVPRHALLQPLVAEEGDDVGPIRAVRSGHERARRVELGGGRARRRRRRVREPERVSVLVALQTLPHPRPRRALDLPAAHLRLVIRIVVAGRQTVETDLGSVRVLHFIGMRER